MGLNSKAVSAEGRGHSGPVAHPAHCTHFADGEGTIEILDGEVGAQRHSHLGSRSSHTAMSNQH